MSKKKLQSSFTWEAFFKDNLQLRFSLTLSSLFSYVISSVWSHDSSCFTLALFVLGLPIPQPRSMAKDWSAGYIPPGVKFLEFILWASSHTGLIWLCTAPIPYWPNPAMHCPNPACLYLAICCCDLVCWATLSSLQDSPWLWKSSSRGTAIIAATAPLDAKFPDP